MANRTINDMVSIVVPVYNVEQYLSDCVNSVLQQTYTNIEVILVDDGSTDKSGKICDDFASEDNRVFVIHKENGGISNARNTGIGLVHGQWVMFVDSDDWIEKDCIERLISNVLPDTDVVACGAKVISSNMSGNKVTCKNAKYVGNESIREAYSGGELKNIFYGPIGKLYNYNIVKNIRFDEELIVAEDIVFNVDVLCACNNIVTIDYFGYNIRNNAESTTHKIGAKYSPMYEHGYTLISDKIFEARKKLGIPENELTEARRKGFAQRYFEEVSNLFRFGTPYNRKEKFKKIKTINNDKGFIEQITKRKFSSLLTAEKIAWVSAKIGITVVTYYMFFVLLKMGKKI